MTVGSAGAAQLADGAQCVLVEQGKSNDDVRIATARRAHPSPPVRVIGCSTKLGGQEPDRRGEHRQDGREISWASCDAFANRSDIGGGSTSPHLAREAPHHTSPSRRHALHRHTRDITSTTATAIDDRNSNTRPVYEVTGGGRRDEAYSRCPILPHHHHPNPARPPIGRFAPMPCGACTINSYPRLQRHLAPAAKARVCMCTRHRCCLESATNAGGWSRRRGDSGRPCRCAR